MATNNSVNTGLQGETGSGQFVGNTSPTLVTPEIGVATGTSINLSASTTIDGFIDDDSMATASNSTGTTSEAIKAFVNNTAYFERSRVATTANFAATYNNGTAGIGATLTATANGAANIDGVALSVNDRVVFKDQTNAFENGLYYLSTNGDGANPSIFTRYDRFDEPSEIQRGKTTVAVEGDDNSRTFWIQTDIVNTIGTDSINFIQNKNIGITPIVKVGLTANQSIPATTFTIAQFDDVEIDTTSDFDTINYRWIPSEAGKYFLYTALYYENLDKNVDYRTIITKNGTYIATDYQVSANVAHDKSGQISIIAEANGTTDYFDVVAYQTSAAAKNILDDVGTVFCGFKIAELE